MTARFIMLPRFILCLALIFGVSHNAFSAADDNASDLGVDYAFLFLMTLSPDFAAANYTIHNEGGSDVDIAIGRFPFHFELIKNDTQKLQLELSLAYQQTGETVPVLLFPGESIDSKWSTYGGGIGLLYGQALTQQLSFTPSLRTGVARMKNHATYNGSQINEIKDLFEGTLFNWNTYASIINLGLGLDYDWTLRNRASSIKADVYHVIVDSFNESNAAVKFTERANMLALTADMIFPTDIHITDKRLDFVLLLGVNNFFGENRHTLGYTTSYQFGVGSELPLRWKQSQYGYVRLSGQVLWADNMKGWLLTIGFSPE